MSNRNYNEKAKAIVARKAIYFDLDSEALMKYYCKTNNWEERLKAYGEIKSYLTKHGFSHRQYSGYNSDKPMTFLQVERLVYDMSRRFPWLEKCVKKFDVTNISKHHSMLFIIENANKPNTFEAKRVVVKKYQPKPIPARVIESSLMKNYFDYAKATEELRTNGKCTEEELTECLAKSIAVKGCDDKQVFTWANDYCTKHGIDVEAEKAKTYERFMSPLIASAVSADKLAREFVPELKQSQNRSQTEDNANSVQPPKKSRGR